MAILVWIIVSISIAVMANQFKNHDSILNITVALVASIGVGGGYAIYAKEANQSIFEALTKFTWQNFIASLLATVVLVILAQVLTYKEHKQVMH